MTGLMKRSGKRTVCGMVSSRNRKPPCGKKLVWQRLCTMRRLLCLYSNRPLRELSGLDTESSRWFVADARQRRFVVVCWRLDRLGRNLKHLITLLEETPG